MQVFAGHVTSHRSQDESSKMRERGNRDGDKLLCNTNCCRLKGERRPFSPFFAHLLCESLLSFPALP